MAHEIKNPLTPILLSAQRLRNLFLDKLDEKDSRVIDKTTQTIIDQVASMDSMVSAFADYANTPEIRKTLSSLNTLINKSASLYDNHDDVRVDLDLSGDLPKMQLDRDAISRVLINLIKNAIESVQEKCLEITNTKGKISIEINDYDDYIEFTIEDNGKGFKNLENIKKILNPYFTTKKKGTGLGLAIVNKIINDHNGSIKFVNLNDGAKVTVEFLKV